MASTKAGDVIWIYSPSLLQSVCFFFPSYLRELAVSKPLQPPHAVAGLPFAGGAPRHHDARPPGKPLNFPPHQLTNAKTFVVLGVGEKTQMKGAEEESIRSYKVQSLCSRHA